MSSKRGHFQQTRKNQNAPEDHLHLQVASGAVGHTLAIAVDLSKPAPSMNKPSKSEEYCKNEDASLALVVVETRQRGRVREGLLL